MDVHNSTGMESFSEGEKKAILGEIQRIRRVLHDDVEHSNDPMYFSSDDSSVEEYSSASDYGNVSMSFNLLFCERGTCNKRGGRG